MSWEPPGLGNPAAGLAGLGAGNKFGTDVFCLAGRGGAGCLGAENKFGAVLFCLAGRGGAGCCGCRGWDGKAAGAGRDGLGAGGPAGAGAGVGADRERPWTIVLTALVSISKGNPIGPAACSI